MTEHKHTKECEKTWEEALKAVKAWKPKGEMRKAVEAWKAEKLKCGCGKVNEN